MKNRFLAGLALLTLVVLGVFCLSVRAQTTEEGPAPSDQPSAPMEVGQPQGPAAQPAEAQPGGPTGEGPAKTDLGVARISLIHGDVSTQRGDSGDWSAAALNQPVMGGDKVSTGDGARVELQLDFANTFRLGTNSKANIATLTQKDIQIQLSQGIANYSVSKDSEAEPEIDLPNVSVHPAHHDGVFRIEVRPDGDTLIIVRKMGPDRFFTAEQQQRLDQLMTAWRAARDTGNPLSPDEQAELEPLVDAEVRAATERAAAWSHRLAP